MARKNPTTGGTPKPPKPPKPPRVAKVTGQCVWKKLVGKYHLRSAEGPRVIRPGDTLVADASAFVGDSSWENLGPVDNTSEQEEVV